MASRMGTDEEMGQNKSNGWMLDQKLDQPMDEEAMRLKNTSTEKEISTMLLLQLAFQSLGVVYGDLGTSPLYVYYNTFPRGIAEPEDVIGVLSLIIYSLTLVPLIKYVFIVSRATDNGQGGTFALYSLLCRHAKIKIFPNYDQSDEKLTTYNYRSYHEKSLAAKTKRWLEKYAYGKTALLVLVLVGSCMVIGDGILTPAISVLSAVDGINITHPKLSKDMVLMIAVALIIILFSMQHYGTDKVGWLFSPIVFVWFLLIGGIGIYNICKYETSVLKAFSPVYIYRYFKQGGKDSWTSLGGVMLSLTGTEALFADLSLFPVPAIQIAFTVVVFPCLLLAYVGQAAYLVQNSDQVVGLFYHSIPDSIYFPVYVVATLAAIVASQATICATFSLIKQAVALGCFPRVKVIHTSKKYPNQIYIPDINWILMILCITVTTAFKSQYQIGNASGAAVVIVMLVTTFLMILIMLLVWRSHWMLILIFTVLSLVVELTYFSAVILKVNQGGWVPLVIATVFFIIMYVWHYGTVKHYEFEMHNKVPLAWILRLGPSLGLVRVPGVGLVYSELASGVPNIFSHLITNVPAIHSVVIFVCVKYLPVYTVPEGERFLIKRIGTMDFHMFRCVVRYGYSDLRKKDDDFENKLFDSLFMFFRLENLMDGFSDSDEHSSCDQETEGSRDDCLLNGNGNAPEFNVNSNISFGDSIVLVDSPLPKNNTIVSSSQASKHSEVDGLAFTKRCRDAGVVHLMGNTILKAKSDSRFYKKITIDYVYAFLRKICREKNVIFHIPYESLLNVGQVYYV
ncbi:potassium transporter 11-like isoform X1 [Quercus lobata]|uniref:Potassium transporter n=1 Tax=Quercus lobata TaxID=97700 RepID=A0A7N2MVG1_QUELO|nr:potassium transporter 11-like isoform X1 [Quercus lobata]